MLSWSIGLPPSSVLDRSSVEACAPTTREQKGRKQSPNEEWAFPVNHVLSIPNHRRISCCSPPVYASIKLITGCASEKAISSLRSQHLGATALLFGGKNQLSVLSIKGTRFLGGRREFWPSNCQH